MLDPLDYLKLDSFRTAGQAALQARLRAFVDAEVLPVINDYWEREEIPFPLIARLRELGIAGVNIKGHGCPGFDALETGLVAFELGRGDISLSTIFGVHSGLCMGSIDRFGTEEQKERWLPSMAAMDRLGAFAMTEPESGSDLMALGTTFEVQPNGDFVVSGRKRWIGNASIAGLLIVMARFALDGLAAALADWQEDGLLGPLRLARPSGRRRLRRLSHRPLLRVGLGIAHGRIWRAHGFDVPSAASARLLPVPRFPQAARARASARRRLLALLREGLA